MRTTPPLQLHLGEGGAGRTLHGPLLPWGVEAKVLDRGRLVVETFEGGALQGTDPARVPLTGTPPEDRRPPPHRHHRGAGGARRRCLGSVAREQDRPRRRGVGPGRRWRAIGPERRIRRSPRRESLERGQGPRDQDQGGPRPYRRREGAGFPRGGGGGGARVPLPGRAPRPPVRPPPPCVRTDRTSSTASEAAAPSAKTSSSDQAT